MKACVVAPWPSPFPYSQINNLANWQTIACGDLFTLAVNTDGNLWTSGNNISGQLGDGTTTDKTNLTQVNCTSLGINNVKYKSISVFPNPTNDYINISNGINIEKIILTNVLGKIVFEATQHLSKVNVESFQSGIYILNIYTNDKKYNIKFIKE